MIHNEAYICPANTGFPFPAVPIKDPVALLPAIPCVGVYNSLDFPVGAVPVTNESEKDQKVGTSN